MYKIAEQNAQWVPFAKHPLMKETNKQKKTDYIILLLYCLSLDKGEIVNGLTFICWLKNKLEVDTTIQTLYMQVFKLKDKHYFIITQEGDSRQKIIEYLKQEESK